MAGRIIGSGTGATGVVDLSEEAGHLYGAGAVYVHATADAVVRFIGSGQSTQQANTFDVLIPAGDQYHKFDVEYESMEVVSGTVDWYATAAG